MGPSWLAGGPELPVTRGLLNNARKPDAVRLDQRNRESCDFSRQQEISSSLAQSPALLIYSVWV